MKGIAPQGRFEEREAGGSPSTARNRRFRDRYPHNPLMIGTGYSIKRTTAAQRATEVTFQQPDFTALPDIDDCLDSTSAAAAPRRLSAFPTRLIPPLSLGRSKYRDLVCLRPASNKQQADRTFMKTFPTTLLLNRPECAIE